jgi:hypothetical protein
MNIMANFKVFVCFCFRYELKFNSEIPGVRPDILDLTGMECASFRIRIHLIRIQGFDDQKLTAKISFFCYHKLYVTYPQSHTGRPSYRRSL